MHCQTRSAGAAPPEVDLALRPDAQIQASQIPIAVMASPEHGSLVVMKVTDMAFVLDYFRSRRECVPSLS